MASLTKDKNGKWRLRYCRENRVREATFRANKLDAEKLKLIVEHRLDQMITGEADPQLAKWLKDLAEPLREVLERHELLEASRRKATVGDLITEFQRSNADMKPNTVSNRESAAKNLLRFFTPSRRVDSISPKDADAFFHWMKHESKTCGGGTALRPATYLRRITTIKMIFDLAVRYKWLEENPFSHIKGGNASNEGRFHFITTEDAQKIYNACPNAFWRLVWALTRWGGIRTRSEFPLLRWDGILWDENKITIYEPKKTRKHEDFKTRFIPLFPELRESLNEAWDLSKEGDTYLADFYARLPHGHHVKRDGTWNPTTTLQKIVRKAGVNPWPKLLQNCRSTRETELAAIYPIHDVTRWIGNSTQVAMKHYLQVTDATFQQAANATSVLETKSAPAEPCKKRHPSLG